MTYVRTPAVAYAPVGYAPPGHDQAVGTSQMAYGYQAASPFVVPPAARRPAQSLRLAPRPAEELSVPAETRVRQARYETLDVDLDAERRLFRCRLRPVGRPCFSPELLRDVASMHASIGALFNGGRCDPDAPVRYFACSSAIPGVFNLGGDLGLFQKLIEARDLARLIHQGWRTWCKPLIGHRIRLRDLNPADFGAHARQG